MRRFFYVLGMFFFIGAVAAVCIAIYAADYYSGEGPLSEPKVLLFPHGTGFQTMTRQMADAGVIDNPLVFEGVALAMDEARKFQAGEYQFTPKMTPHAIMAMLAGGKVLQHKITFAEGLEVRDIVKLVQAEPLLEGEVPATIPEGSLLPETYQFSRGYKRADLIAQMQKAMHTALDAAWAKRKGGLPYATAAQALVMASIVEKETGLVNERAHVASVFVNRLNRGMKLQTDPTVAYGVEQALGGPMGRPLTIADLQTPTTYNTYMIDGLPPGPICNPGKASIEAALNPSDTEDLYFVATGTGGHHFASTLEEHNKNVAAYREKMSGR